jgi:putative endonuclease
MQNRAPETATKLISAKDARFSRRCEEDVAAMLADAGWKILGQNYRGRGFELDIIAEKGMTLVIVEVKGRKSIGRELGDMAGLVGVRKRHALIRGARAFLSRTDRRWAVVRFDLAVLERKKTGNNLPVLQYFVGFMPIQDES